MIKLVRAWLMSISMLLLVFSCSSKSYNDIIPVDAKAVAEFSLTESAKKSLPSILTGSAIDLESPLYAFVTQNEYMGLAVPVRDAHALAIAMTEAQKTGLISSTPRQKDGLWWTETDGWQIAWNDKALLVYGPGVVSDRSALRKTMTQLFDADYESFSQSEDYAKFESLQGSFKLVASLDVLPTPYNMLFSMGMPQGVNPADVKMYAHASAETKDGENVAVKCELSSERDDVENAYREKAKKSVKVGGTLISSAPEGTFLSFLTNTEGESLLAAFRRDRTTRMMLAGANRGIDADLMIKSIQGDMAVFVPSFSKDGMPDYLLLAELASKSFLSDIPYWKQSIKGNKDISLTSVGKGYLLKSQDIKTYFGVKGNVLYLSSSEKLANEACEKSSACLPPSVASTAKKAYLDIYLDVDQMLSQEALKKKLGGTANFFKTLLVGAHRIHYVMSDLQHATLTIEQK